jgi:hypothetical protein
VRGRPIPLPPLPALVLALGDESLGISPAEVVRVMSSRRTQIRRACYEDNKQKLEASMRIDFDIGPTGKVTGAKANSVMGPPAVAECVVGEVKRTIFPGSEIGGHFRWPFIFKGP